MAAERHSNTRRRILGAAAALPVLALTGLPTHSAIASGEAARQPSPTETLWSRRLARYRRLHARWQAEAETGAFRAANDEYERVREQMIARFGSWEKARRTQTGRPLCAAAFVRVSAAEDVYYDRFTAPMQRAATVLIQTPVPDLEGLLTKLDVILKHEIDDWEGTAPYPWEALRNDVRLVARMPSGSTITSLT